MRVLLRGVDEEEKQRGKKGVIVKVSQDLIQQLSRHAKYVPKRRSSSEEAEPFNLRSREPIYSNKFGRLYEITPDHNQQLKDLDIFLSLAEIKEVTK